MGSKGLMKKSKNKPDIEKKLLALQQEYLNNKSPHIYQQMFNTLVPYAKSLILKTTKGKVFIQPDVVYDLAIETVIKFLANYEKEGWKVSSSFGGILRYKVLETLYSPISVKEENISSLNHMIDTFHSRNKTELGELKESVNFKYLFIKEIPDVEISKESKIEEIFSIIEKTIQDIFISQKPYNSFIISIGIYLFIKNKCVYKKFLQNQDVTLKNAIEFSILELKNRLCLT